ncbi:MAG: hypothetical protein IPI90_08810 [Saprospiraceae bacterium]|nr:hypothetical protein [Candidatus Vicinibacter affinis]
MKDTSLIKSRPDIASLLAIAYIFSLSLINQPVYGKISLSEVIFPFLLVTIFYHHKVRISIKSFLNPSDFFIFLLVVILVIYTTIYTNNHTVFNLVTMGYLLLLGLIFRMFSIADSKGFVKVLILGFSLCGMSLVLTGSVGWIWALICKQHNIWAWYYLDFPYLGDIPRARGWAGTPEMMASLLSVSLLLKCLLPKTMELNSQLLKWAMGIEFVGLFLCFSKTLILLVGIFIFMSAFQFYGTRKVLVFIYGLLFCLLYLVGTNFIWINSHNSSIPNSSKIAITKIRTIGKDNYIFSTPYYELKRAAILAGKEKGFFFIKGATFNSWLDHLKIEKKFPEHLESYDPHCTYLGAFAELGWLGLLIVFGLLASPILTCIFPLNGIALTEHRLILGFSLFFFLLAFNTDLLHFRHWWIISIGSIRFLTTKPLRV